ncbi:hypothetical protein HK405_006110, partial [Cladochytrium tenue]
MDTTANPPDVAPVAAAPAAPLTSANAASAPIGGSAVAPVAPGTAAVGANPNSKVVDEFQYLLEKSQQLFAGLRDLPPTGKNWQPYFQRTFEVYTKLWKFQQQHRAVLENRELYGLKRWEIGEIASKIGQLYYHYYLRTSETNYLYESYVFYEAIRDRQYFRDVIEAKNPGLMIKKLRYYARFIVVCLLLNRNDIIKKLMEELESLVQQYTKDFKPADAAEWNVVLTEISTFLEAERKLAPVDADGVPFSTPSRLVGERSSKAVDKDAQPRLRLQEAILVGNYQNQIKFSELTLDMYRLLQSLEREPNAQGGKAPAAPAEAEKKDEAVEGGTAAADTERGSSSRRANPHKYLLYRPTFAQLYLYISTAFKDISDNTAMLLYISADGTKRQGKTANPGYAGGVTTAVNFSRKALEKGDADQTSLIHSLHPADLVPFTRKPLFLLLDSNNSTAFIDIPREFNQPLVVLMSPTEYPSSIKDTTQIGSLFTLFLHSPIKAFAFVSDLAELQADVWGKCVPIMNAAEKAIADLLLEGDLSASLDKSFKRFLQDDFLRQITVRFVLCSTILMSHVHFKESK